MSEDNIYAAVKTGDEPFRFDEAVTRVFPDMLKRSIPGYSASLEAIGALAARYVTPGSNCFDLGCSLGAATLAMRQGIQADNCRIVAIDNSPAMIERCREVIAADNAASGQQTEVDLQLGDILEADIANASMVVMNYTLQFIAPNARQQVIQKIADGLLPGGLLVLSEKVVDEDPHMEELLIDLYHEHKRRNHYSELEIARKRAALENVLIPETITQHRKRLTSAGFANTAVWLRYFNFVSLIAIKNTD